MHGRDNASWEIIETFYIVDFDRTLADSDKLLEVFLQVTHHYLDIPTEQITSIYSDMSARGDSFDTASYVRDRLREENRSEDWDRLSHRFIHESHALDMLLPGADELIAYFDATQARYGILTYGNPLWQRLKLAAAGFRNVPHIVTTSKHKGMQISDWLQGDGSVFVVPSEYGGGLARRIVLIDDKAVSFDGFPKSPSEGCYVVDLDRMLPTQKGDVPENVQHYTNLAEVTKYLKSIDLS